MHQALERAWVAGHHFVPRPLKSLAGQTTLHDGSHTWELTHWLPGRADYLENPSPQRLLAAVTKLALLHDTWSGHAEFGPSLAAVSRFQLLSAWLGKQDVNKAELSQRLRGHTSEVAELAMRTLSQLSLLGPDLANRLRQAADEPVKQHFVIRDIWSDHVLFEDEEVTGIIDFGAARVDEPATDLVRLLASIEPHNGSAWDTPLATYEEIAQPLDRNRLALLDQASTLLSAAQWFAWIVLEPRRFDALQGKLIARWAGFLRRLEQDGCYTV